MALAKTTRPRLKGVFPRKRLFRLLDDGADSPLTWLRGPPGAGKTTLVASYLDARKLPCLWYQVDAGDGDIATFFYHLREAAPKRGRPLPLLTPEYLPNLSVFTQRFFVELFERCKTPFVLVFDNYQDAPLESKFQEVVRDACAQVPQGARIIAVSRAGPPPEMARQRANRALIEIGPAELQLTLEESRGLAKAVSAAHWSPQQLRTWHAATDGWAAGLILMLERLKNAPSSAGEIAADRPEDVFDYFAAEILSKSDADTQAVLLKTALLPRVTAPLAIEITGLPNAVKIIDDLARERYFTNKHQAAYQYHPLFREFLITQGQRTFAPAARAQLLRQGAAALEAAGFAEDAIPLLREAEDWPALARLIEAHAQMVVGQGRSQTVVEWLGYLPQIVIDERPWLLYWRGVCRVWFNAAEGWANLEKAFAMFWSQHDATGSFLAWCTIVQSIIHSYSDFNPLDGWIERLSELEAAFPQFPSVEIEARVTAIMLCALVSRQPDHPEILRWERRAEELLQIVDHAQLRIALNYSIVGFNYWRGNFGKSIVLMASLRQVADSVEAPILDRIVAIATVARFEWLTSSAENAISIWSESLQLAETSGVHVLDVIVEADCISAYLSMGKFDKARALLDKLASAVTIMNRCELFSYHSVAGFYEVLCGDSSSAVAHCQRAIEYLEPFGMPLADAIFAVFYGEILYACGQKDAARARIDNALALALRCNAMFVEYICLLVRAHFDCDEGKEAACIEGLSRAMFLGRQHGYINFYVWRADVMTCLCAKALEAGIEVDYVRGLIRKRGLLPDPSVIGAEQWPWAIKIYALGRFNVFKNDQALQFSRKSQRKPMDLLKALVAFGGREVAESQIEEALWPDADGDAANQALSTTLHRLRKLLGNDEIIQRQDGKLTLDPHYCWVDLWSVERLLGQAEGANGHAQPNGAARPDAALALDKALALYQGPFLGENELSWAIVVTERLKRRFVRALRQIGLDHEKESRWESAIDAYEKALGVEVASEELYRRLMTAHAQLGQRVEALRVYDRCRRNLSALAGIAPSRETEALYQSLRAG